MFELKNYSVNIPSKSILRGISYTFETGFIYAILGQNGSGKSSLAFSLMGHPRYQVSGNLLLSGEDIITLDPHDRSAKGLFLSFQNIPEIPGVTLMEYLRTIYNTHITLRDPHTKPVTSILFRRILTKLLADFRLDISFLERDLYVGFSGGEKRRIELLQIRLLDPEYIILDEIDSGLDIDAIDILVTEVRSLREKGKCIIMITHNFDLLDEVSPDQAIILQDGSIQQSGGNDLIKKLRNSGF